MMWDNSESLINYIRNTFTTCDDTGVCEAVLKLPFVIDEKPGAVRVLDGNKFTNDEDEDGNDRSSTSEHSPDIHVDVGHRRRSETSKRLETLKLQRLAQSKIKTVQWKEPISLSNVFDVGTSVHNGVSDDKPMISDWGKETCKAASTVRCRTSAVSQFIRASADLPVNPFQAYMKFDGNACLGASCKKIRVFPLMACSQRARSEPLDVFVASTAKVCDLIGLICFHYTARNLSPKLSTDISRYALHVAEDTGELDSDLPPRSPHENVSRFHFPHFALVDHGVASSAFRGFHQNMGAVKKCCVVVHASTGEKFKLEFDSSDTPLRTVRDCALAMRFEKNENKANMEYNIEKLDEPNRSLPLDSSVATAGTNEFMLVRVHSARPDLVLSPATVTKLDYAASPSGFQNTVSSGRFCHLCHLCHQYPVTMVRKFKRDVKVQLVISSERLEISPNADGRKISTSSAAKLFRSFRGQIDSGNNEITTFAGDRKTVTFHLKQIGGGEIMEEKSGRKTFRIVHKHNNSSGEWKSHQFEADLIITEEIVLALNRHLDLLCSDVRQEFLKRTPRKTSIFKRIQQGDLSFGDAAAGGASQN